jgi:hypothetical protein
LEGIGSLPIESDQLDKRETKMQDTIVTMYCVCDDVLRALGYQDDPQTRYAAAEVMTVPLVAAAFFGGNLALSRRFLHQHGYTRHTLSASRFNRRLHALPLAVWQTVFDLLGQVFKAHHPAGTYTVDSMPFPVCDNIRIKRCKLLRGEEHRGYCASKRRYFFGLKVHLLITGAGAPVEFVLTPGSVGDLPGFKGLPLDLPAGAIVHGDRAYNDYQEEDLLRDAGAIVLRSQRKKNSKRPLAPWLEALGRPVRQRIETTFSQVAALLPRHVQAVTARGFVLKVMCFLLAVSFRYLEG